MILHAHAPKRLPAGMVTPAYSAYRQISGCWSHILRPAVFAHLNALSSGWNKALHRGCEHRAGKLLHLRLPPLQQPQPPA